MCLASSFPPGESQENITVFKRAVTQRHAGWSSKGWSSKSKWQRSAKSSKSRESGKRCPTIWRKWGNGEIHCVGKYGGTAKVEDSDKGTLKKTLKQLSKDNEEESAAREPFEEMQQNVTDAQERARETERRLCEDHVLMGPRIWKSKQPQRQNLANDAKQ